MTRTGPRPTALVVGSGPTSAQAALDLAQAGVGVTLLASEDWLVPTAGGPLSVPLLLSAARHPGIDLFTGATVSGVRALERKRRTPSAVAGGESPSPGLAVTVRQAPRFVDAARCTACGACVDVCPVSLPDGNKVIAYLGGVPTTYAINKAGTAPCRDACPIDQRAQGYIALIRAGDFQAAYRTIKEENPFPSVCGRVCNHRCEDACTRAQVDAPIAVMALKRFVADWAAEQGVRFESPVAPRSGYRVAVIGAGPAGLTAARDLNRLGHKVTVLEALPVAGGMMRVGIPGFRLPRERLQAEIDEILREGVQLRTSSRVEDVHRLFAAGYDAVVLAVGLHVSRQLGVPGENGAPGSEQGGVMGAVEFLHGVNLGDRPHWEGEGRRVVVVGGGSTAMDTARVCRRLGADVSVIYRRSRAEMPAHDFEVDDAENEGVRLRYLANPRRIIREAGRVVAIECVRMALGEPDESGRRRPVPIPNSEFVLEADVVLTAIGQASDLSLLGAQQAAMASKGVVQRDPATLMTSHPGLFVAGDAAGTDGFVVDAIASGSQAARSVDRYLRGDQGTAEPAKQPVVRLDSDQIAGRLRSAAPRGSARAVTPTLLPERLLDNFQETGQGLSQDEAMAEAGRCLNCGLCSECLACVRACPPQAIDHQRTAESWELQVGAAIWTTAPGEGAYPGIFVARDPSSVSGLVSQTLAYLGVLDVPEVSRAGRPAPAAGPARRTYARGQEPRIGAFLCRCGGEISRTVDLGAVAARVQDLPGVALVSELDFACHPEGKAALETAVAAHRLDGAVLAACSCCALDHVCYSCTTQRTRCKEQLGVWDDLAPLPVQFANVREQCAFVHRDVPQAATTKAGDLVAASVAALALKAGSGWGAEGAALGASSRLPIVAAVDAVRCRGCEDCEVACGLEAMHVVGQNGVRLAQVDATRCLGCGVCMAVCSSGAIVAGDTTDAQAEAMLAAMGDLSDTMVVFSCNWGAYSAVESAGSQCLSYDPSVRLIRLMCAGWAHAGLILRSFAQGAARVLVLACEDQGAASQCHYRTGEEQAAKNVRQAQRLLGLLGIDPARLALTSLRPGDGAGFVTTVEAFVQTPAGVRLGDRG
jgi:NADPH-dependent glutamate synthase beta subunit-like oxidoreductase/coenzyme F420-reducing hydrogenase delta subunit/Pyruvate/2-oxoacid:ferredoxin oxidoreductase delta subunit